MLGGCRQWGYGVGKYRQNSILTLSLHQSLHQSYLCVAFIKFWPIDRPLLIFRMNIRMRIVREEMTEMGDLIGPRPDNKMPGWLAMLMLCSIPLPAVWDLDMGSGMEIAVLGKNWDPLSLGGFQVLFVSPEGGSERGLSLRLQIRRYRILREWVLHLLNSSFLSNDLGLVREETDQYWSTVEPDTWATAKESMCVLCSMVI